MDGMKCPQITCSQCGVPVDFDECVLTTQDEPLCTACVEEATEHGWLEEEALDA